MLTLLLGGTRSGKSRFAEQTAIETEDNVIYIAIAIAGDQEMQTCIDRHRHKVEGPIGLAAAISDHVAPGLDGLFNALHNNKCAFRTIRYLKNDWTH